MNTFSSTIGLASLSFCLSLLSACDTTTKKEASEQQANIDLKYAHFMPAGSWQNKTLFKDWAEAVAKASNNQLNVTVYPAQTLGKAPAGYDNAKKGITDMHGQCKGIPRTVFP